MFRSCELLNDYEVIQTCTSDPRMPTLTSFVLRLISLDECDGVSQSLSGWDISFITTQHTMEYLMSLTESRCEITREEK